MPVTIKDTQRQDKYFLFSFCLFSFYALTSLLRGLSAIAIQMPIVMISYAALFISVNAGKDKKYASNFLFITVATVLFNYLLIFKQGGAAMGSLQNKIGANFTLFSTSMPLFFVCSDGLERVNREKVKNIILIIVAFTALTTIIGTFKYISPCRELATPYNTEIDNLYKSQNIGGYGFVYFLVLIAPLLLREIRNKFSVKYLILFLLNAYCVIRSEYTTAILLLFVAVCLCIIIWSKNIFIRLVTLCIGLAVPLNFEKLVSWAVDIFTPISFTISTRLKMFLQYYKYDNATGDVEIRQELYQKSWNSFIHNPLLGGMAENGNCVGGHSEILDFIGFSGIFGIIIFFACVIYLRHNSPINKIDFNDSFIRLLYVVAIALAAFNTFSSPELFYALLVMPLLMSSDKSSDIRM